ncbi:MAG: hypothetical protein A2283_19755 [Lentisphaerae bacterium RIFOXYA12_FULL_48_11]|nr:MAG: hypothetical protein A2283_19755 [Lentisphaerae bacterium RIFOXYA12_FULL_48_11]
MKDWLLEQVPDFLEPYVMRIQASPLGSRLARGAFWSFAGAVISRGLSLISSILVARMLGKEGFGELGIIQSSVGMFATFAGFGLGLTATKYVAEFRTKDPAKAGKIIGLSSIVSLVTGSLITIILLISASWLASRTLNAPQLSVLLQLSAPLLLLGAWGGAQTGALAGFESFKRIAQINLVSGLLNFPLMVGGVYIAGLTGAVWGLLIANMVGCLLNSWALRVEMRKAAVPVIFSGCRSEWPILWKFSLPSLLSGIMVGPVTWACNAMLVNQPNGYAEMGIFNAANQWFNALLFLPSIVGSVILPVLSEKLGNQEGKATAKILTVAILMNAIIALPLVILLCLFSHSVMAFYGQDFSDSWLVLVVVVCTAGLLSVQSPVGHIIAASGRMWVGMIMNLGWGLAFLGFTFLLVRHGSFGLASARLLAYLLHAIWTFAFAIAVIKKSREVDEIVSG